MKLLTPFFILVFLLSIGTVYADVECEEMFDSTSLRVKGTIKATDVVAARNCIESAEKLSSLVALDSPGGDVYAAMELGRLLRENRLMAAVPLPPGQCMSSCVFVLAGSIDRNVYGKIGIHRPYSMKTGLIDFEDAQSQYKKTRTDIKNYLNEMNITSSLFDAMERIPPEKMRILTREEVDGFGLDDIDPVEQEVRDANEADLRGISRLEYMRRVSEASQICWAGIGPNSSRDEFQNAFDCEAAYSWGLNTRVFKERRDNVRICRQLWQKFGPESNEFRECKREVMLGVRP